MPKRVRKAKINISIGKFDRPSCRDMRVYINLKKITFLVVLLADNGDIQADQMIVKALFKKRIDYFCKLNRLKNNYGFNAKRNTGITAKTKFVTSFLNASDFVI